MSNGEFLGTGDYRVGYLKPLGQPWRPVLCSVVNDHLVLCFRHAELSQPSKRKGNR